MRRTTVLALAATLALVAQPVRAQVVPTIPDPGDIGFDSKFAAYFALTSTPLGVLSSAVSPPAAGKRRIGLRAQFGQITDPGLVAEAGFDVTRRVIAGGLDIPLGRGTLALAGGYLDYGCDEIGGQIDFDGDGVNDFGLSLGCNSGMTGAASWSMPLISADLGPTGRTGFLLGLDAAVGGSSGDLLAARLSGADTGFPLDLSVKLGASTLAAGLGLPVGVVVRSGGVTVVPHVLPRVAWGRTKLSIPALGGVDGDTGGSTAENDVRLMLGGGLGLQFAGTGLGLNFGVQKVFVEGGKVAFGAGLSWAMR